MSQNGRTHFKNLAANAKMSGKITEVEPLLKLLASKTITKKESDKNIFSFVGNSQIFFSTITP